MARTVNESADPANKRLTWDHGSGNAHADGQRRADQWPRTKKRCIGGRSAAMAMAATRGGRGRRFPGIKTPTRRGTTPAAAAAAAEECSAIQRWRGTAWSNGAVARCGPIDPQRDTTTVDKAS
ncbi:hypothetical protein Scep_025107 [Stephania cephalantha]|uniref:Uncharacterized protein n=1 Tax=Stephania cephalantha TaxID=152367 RepID=A0AAP0EPY3_9MAGN